MAGLLSKLLPVSQPNIYSLLLYLHISYSLTLELAFGDSGEAWGTKIKAFYFKEWGLRSLGMISIQNSLYLPWKDWGMLGKELQFNSKHFWDLNILLILNFIWLTKCILHQNPANLWRVLENGIQKKTSCWQRLEIQIFIKLYQVLVVALC